MIEKHLFLHKWCGYEFSQVAVFRVASREKGRGNGEWREARRAKEDVSIRKGGNAPLYTRLGVMKCSLHPVFYVLLGFSLPRVAAFTEHSGQVAMNICIQLWQTV